MYNKKAILLALMVFVLSLTVTIAIPLLSFAGDAITPPATSGESVSPGDTEIPSHDGNISFTWAQIGTFAGATVVTLAIVQLAKFPLDKVWKIPTRFLVYCVALVLSIGAKYFTGGLTMSDLSLQAINAVFIAASAMGTYEATINRKKKNL